MIKTVINTKGAYSGFAGRTLLKNIKYSKEKEIASFFLDEGIYFEPDANQKGGIIIFSTEVNAQNISSNAFINAIKQRFATLKNNLNKNKKINAIDKKYDLLGWTVGKYLSGRYTSKYGKVFNENSLSLEIVGVDIDTLISIAEDICKEFNQWLVLVKDYSSNRIFSVQDEIIK